MTDKWFVYLIKCNDNSYYTGITKDITRRMHEHNNTRRGAKYTMSRRPVALFKYFTVDSKSSALKEEIKIKKLKQKEKISYFLNR